MKSIAVLITMTGLITFASSCHKSGNNNSHAASLDTVQVSFADNGNTINYEDTVPVTVAMPVLITFSTNQAESPTTSCFVFQGNMMITSGEFFLQLTFNQPVVGTLTPGVYTYTLTTPTTFIDSTFMQNAGVIEGGITGNGYEILLSDTVTVNSIINGYASGTFNATFAHSLSGGAPEIHVTQGQFRGARVNQ